MAFQFTLSALYIRTLILASKRQGQVAQLDIFLAGTQEVMSYILWSGSIVEIDHEIFCHSTHTCRFKKGDCQLQVKDLVFSTAY